MAVIQVSSMQGLIDALQSIESYTTIEIMNDLDFNDVVATLTTAVLIPVDGSSASLTSDITINGNNHVIYNLDNASVSTALFQFRYCQNVSINDLSLLNCHCTKSSTRLITSTANYYIDFHNVVIQGRFYYAPFTYCRFYDSMLTFDHCTSTLASSSVYTRCWIKFIGCSSTSGSTGIFNNADQCYFTGDYGYTSATASKPLMHTINNCCINVMFTIINSGALTLDNLFKYTSTTTQINIINSEKIVFAVSSALEDTEMCKLVTDEQMKNAEYLADLGFDIIP